MARERKRKRQMSEINVVPYIDVMLVLLVIFMITAPLLVQGVKVTLPQAEAKPLPQKDQEPVIVTVDQNGKYYFNREKKPVTLETLLTRIVAIRQHKQGTQLIVYGDEKVAYGSVIELMSLLKKAGVGDVGLATEPPGGR